MNALLKYIIGFGVLIASLVNCSRSTLSFHTEKEIFSNSVDSLAKVICNEQFGEDKAQNISFKIRIMIYFTDTSEIVVNEYYYIEEKSNISIEELEYFLEEFSPRVFSIPIYGERLQIEKDRYIAPGLGVGGSHFTILITKRIG